MRTDKFREHLALTTPPAHPAKGEVFIPYDRLADHGIRYTRVHLRRLIARGLFPAPVMLSPNRLAWRLSDLEEWKGSRPAAPIAPDAA
jgi:hypothetical protein